MEIDLTPEEGSFLFQLIKAARFVGVDAIRVAFSITEKLKAAGVPEHKPFPAPPPPVEKS